MKNSQRRCFELLVLVSVLLSLAFTGACTKKSQQGEDALIKIGAISPFTGEGANYGKAARTAIDLAVDEINGGGGINGKN